MTAALREKGEKAHSDDKKQNKIFGKKKQPKQKDGLGAFKSKAESSLTLLSCF